MTFHESFWAATSAVAPVIALAAVVALPDAATLIGRANSILQGTLRQSSNEYAGQETFLAMRARETRHWAWIAWLATLANMMIQAGLLTVSLCALAYRQDIVPLWLAIVLATGGILLLAWSTFVSANWRWALEHELFGQGGSADSETANGVSGGIGE